jgi:hypothetical protein
VRTRISNPRRLCGTVNPLSRAKPRGDCAHTSYPHPETNLKESDFIPPSHLAKLTAHLQTVSRMAGSVGLIDEPLEFKFRFKTKTEQINHKVSYTSGIIPPVEGSIVRSTDTNGRATRRVVSIVVALMLAVIALWALSYPSESDPKNMRYVFWKVGLLRMDLDRAAGAMIGDRGRDKLVLGRTKAELRDKFGFLLSPAEASEYLRNCYESSDWKGEDVMFIRRSDWMVVFKGDTVTELVLIKGC